MVQLGSIRALGVRGADSNSASETIFQCVVKWFIIPDSDSGVLGSNPSTLTSLMFSFLTIEQVIFSQVTGTGIPCLLRSDRFVSSTLTSRICCWTARHALDHTRLERLPRTGRCAHSSLSRLPIVSILLYKSQPNRKLCYKK